MKTILANQLQPEILKFLDELTKTKEEIALVNSKSKKFVMVLEEEYSRRIHQSRIIRMWIYYE